MKQLLLAVGMAVVPSVAMAQDAPPNGAVVAGNDGVAEADPAAGNPGFVTLDRQDATSTVGAEISYLIFDTGSGGNSVTPIRFNAYGSYVDPVSRFGGYAQLPISYASQSSGGQSMSYTGVGDLEVGGIYAPHLNTAGIGLVAHAGLTLPTAPDATDNASIVNVVDSFARLDDIYLAVPKGVSLRLGGSLLLRQNQLFARVDLGADISMSHDGSGTEDTLLRANFAGGIDFGTASLALEIVNIYTTKATTGDFGSSWIDTGALSARFKAGSTSPYVAVGFPLDHDSYQSLFKFDAAITAGVSARLQ